MTDVNSVVLIGNLTKDIEVKYLQSGSAVGNISIAVNRSIKKGDEWTDKVSFFNVTLFGKTAENLKQYLTKGKKIAVTGVLDQDRWKSEDGKSQSSIKIIADNIQLLGGNNSSQKSDVPPAQNESSEPDNFQEDIPF